MQPAQAFDSPFHLNLVLNYNFLVHKGGKTKALSRHVPCGHLSINDPTNLQAYHLSMSCSGIFWGFRVVLSMLLVKLETITDFVVLCFSNLKIEKEQTIQTPWGTYLSKTPSPSQTRNHGATKRRCRSTGDSIKQQGTQYLDKHHHMNRHQVVHMSSPCMEQLHGHYSSPFPYPISKTGYCSDVRANCFKYIRFPGKI